MDTVDKRYFCFRFDVDTEPCISEGTPRLLKLGEAKDARFTFFMNMGRAITRRRRGHNGVRTASAPKLKSIQKLGYRRFLRTALLNPPVGDGHRDVVRAVASSGHEVGLHGGSNHGEWQRHAHEWAQEKVAAELEWGLARLRSAGIAEIRSFSSPGWNRPPSLAGILAALGFDYVADDHAVDRNGCRTLGDAPGLLSVTTNLLGEPGGVGYLEHYRAQGMTDNEILDAFERDLAVCGDFAVAYDHPVFAGGTALHIVGEMLSIARNMGYTITPLAEMVKAWKQQNGPARVQ